MKIIPLKFTHAVSCFDNNCRILYVTDETKKTVDPFAKPSVKVRTTYV